MGPRCGNDGGHGSRPLGPRKRAIVTCDELLPRAIEIRGLRIVAYFQGYGGPPGEPPPRSGELLSRPPATHAPAVLFAELEPDEQLVLLAWHLDMACDLAGAGWQPSINVHNSIVREPRHREAFLDAIATLATPAVFEFTETYPMPPVDLANRLLRGIREAGHRSALDDFGTGLNGMSLLTDYDFDIVKLDGSLVEAIDARPEKQRTLALVRQMLDVLGRDHVVEGVETQGQYAALLDGGFCVFQGHLFGEAVTIDALLGARPS